ncbi:MAG TPA: FAD-binding oxidoreductase, partial [Bacteroidota bacterium]
MTGFSKTLERDLRTLTLGECFFDAPTLELFATDRCWYKIKPLAVLQPRDAGEVSAITKYCYEREVPIIPRGAATGVAGQAIGMGVILDFTRFMNHITATSEETVTVEPGVILGALNAELGKRGKYFPIDPASASQCTVGGMIGTNAAGAHGVRHGATKDHVKELTVILSNGEQAVLKEPAIIDEAHNPFFRRINDSLSSTLMARRELIARRFPNVRKNSSGYNLKDAVAADLLDHRKLIIGSEGTLAVAVQSVLRILPSPSYRFGAIAYFATYEQAVDATILGLDLEPAAVELLDDTYLGLVRGVMPAADRFVMDDARAILYFEFEGQSVQELQQSVVRLGSALSTTLPLRFLPLTEERDLNDLWELRAEASRIINTEKSRGKNSFVEDVAVPLRNLPRYIKGLKAILEQNRIEFCLYGHAGTGNIHCATFVDLRNLSHYRVVDTVASEIYDLAISLGGTLSGEH